VAVFMLVLPLFKATGNILLQIAPGNVPPSALTKCFRQVGTRFGFAYYSVHFGKPKASLRHFRMYCICSPDNCVRGCF
jgi:hypothetical protein